MKRNMTFLVLAALIALVVLLWPKTATQQTPESIPSGAQPARALQASTSSRNAANPLPAFLPREARDMVVQIQRGGPFAHRQDGDVFGNREGLLPRQARGYYREYTVKTPGLDHRGARRIITGGNPPRTWHYTDDHYQSFRAFDVRPREQRP